GWDGAARARWRATDWAARCARGAGSLFFFSSRRRHTRCYRDWSSDVCSSDLGIAAVANAVADALAPLGIEVRELPLTPDRVHRRSEERRVGKECRSRVEALHGSQKMDSAAGEARARGAE